MLIRQAGFGLILPPGVIPQDVYSQSAAVAYDAGHKSFFNPATGEVYGSAPPSGTPGLTWTQRPDGSVYVGYGAGWIAQTPEEAAQMKADVEAQLATRAAAVLAPQPPAAAVPVTQLATSDLVQRLLATWSIAGMDVPVWLVLSGAVGLFWWFSKSRGGQ